MCRIWGRNCVRKVTSIVYSSALIVLLSTIPGVPAASSRRSSDEELRDLDYKYAVVIDAGSTGSRARVYRWLPEHERSDSGLPDIREINDTKIVPGVSEYADNRTLLQRHVVHLIRKSVIHVPKELRSISPIYFMATAGMRMLLEDKAFTAIQIVQETLSNKSINPFWFEYSENARILSGEEEGVFAWIAVNYLSGVFKPNGGKTRDTYGILELGGASTQIAFVPRGNILADKFPVQIGGVVYSLYVHSYLHYGQKYVDVWIKDQLCLAKNCTTKSQTIENPCMLIDDEQFNITEDGTHTIKYVGSGDPGRCSEMLNVLVYKAQEPWHCFPRPCAVGSIYQPTIQPNFKFYALGAFIHSLQSLGIMGADGVMHPSETTKAAFEFCRRPISSMALIRPAKKMFLSTECLMGLYMPILFTKGYGFSNDTDQIQVSKTINGHAIEWPLGAVIYESERRSCKHCPIVRTGCAVTSNAIRIPKTHFIVLFAAILCVIVRDFNSKQFQSTI